MKLTTDFELRGDFNSALNGISLLKTSALCTEKERRLQQTSRLYKVNNPLNLSLGESQSHQENDTLPFAGLWKPDFSFPILIFLREIYRFDLVSGYWWWVAESRQEKRSCRREGRLCWADCSSEAQCTGKGKTLKWLADPWRKSCHRNIFTNRLLIKLKKIVRTKRMDSPQARNIKYTLSWEHSVGEIL